MEAHILTTPRFCSIVHFSIYVIEIFEDGGSNFWILFEVRTGSSVYFPFEFLVKVVAKKSPQKEKLPRDEKVEREPVFSVLYDRDVLSGREWSITLAGY
jgi:hypothetical protein